MLTRTMLRGAIILILVLGVAHGLGFLGDGAPSNSPSHPIVADLVANPKIFVGTRIEIYGLVIESNSATRVLMLEDVSQRPLRVDARKLPPIAAGDQVEIVGVLRRTADGLVLHGESFKRVQVLAGGGCC